MTSSPAIAELIGAVKRFTAPEGGVVKALDGISLTIGQGQFVTLLGPSGCGKTTMLKAIGGFEQLDAGDVRIDGEVMTDRPAHRRPVNTVFQNYALFPHMSVGDNVGYGLDVAGVARAERTARVGAALEMVGLAGFDKRPPRQLSGGQQQRVALARAIVNRPKLLLLDEPLSALDRNLRQSMQIELKTLQDELGICFLFVTHDQEEALTMSDQIVVLNCGQIEQIGGPEALYHRPETRFVASFVGDGALFSGRVQEGALCTEDGLRFPVAEAPPGPATLLFRPEHLTLAEADPGPDWATMDARLERSVFRGATRSYLCRLANGAAITATPPGGGADLAPGAQMRLVYRRDAPHLIPETGHA